MVIKVYQSQVRADTRPTVANAPNINTGATEFYSSLAGTINQTGKELGDFFIKKKQNEIDLESQIQTGSINEQLTDLYNSYLDPNGEMYLSPERWVEGDDSFQTQAQTLINNKYNTIENKIVADRVKAKFSENFLTLEKDLTKQSFERTENLLESNLDLSKSVLIDDISKATDGLGVSILTDELSEVIFNQIKGGFYKDGETLESLYVDAMEQVATNRIAHAANNLTMSELDASFEGRKFVGDPVTSLAFTVLDDEVINKIRDTAVDTKIADIKRSIEINEQADLFFKSENEDDIIKLNNTLDPAEREAIYQTLINKSQGDVSTIEVINEIYNQDNFSSITSIDLNSIKKEIYSGTLDFAELSQLKTQISKTDYNKLFDELITVRKPNSPLVSELQSYINNRFFTENDEYLRALQMDDSKIVDIINAAHNRYLNKFNDANLNIADDQATKDLFDTIITEADEFILQRSRKSLKNYISNPNEFGLTLNWALPIRLESLDEDVANAIANLGTSEDDILKKNMLLEEIELLKLLYGQEVFDSFVVNN